jgi:hypothetical protein
MARRPYTTACRFFKDSDIEIPIRWYPAKEPIEVLPFPSKINSLDWNSAPELASGVGEVYGSPREYNGAKVIDYAHGLTPCQPAEVFRDGEHYDQALPAQKYDEKGFPLCCLDRFVSTGGILLDGTAVVNVIGNTFYGAYTCDASTLIPRPLSGNLKEVISQPAGWFYYDVPAGSTTIHFLSADHPSFFIQVLTSIVNGLPASCTAATFQGTLVPGDSITLSVTPPFRVLLVIGGAFGPVTCVVDLT